MKIFSDDKLSYIDLVYREMLSEREQQVSGMTDVRIAVEVFSRGFSGRNDTVWFGRDDIQRFLKDLQQFEAQRTGTVKFASLGAPSEYCEFRFQLNIVSKTGHAAVTTELLKVQYLQDGGLCPLRLSVGFDIDVGNLLIIIAEFNELLNSQAGSAY